MWPYIIQIIQIQMPFLPLLLLLRKLLNVLVGLEEAVEGHVFRFVDLTEHRHSTRAQRHGGGGDAHRSDCPLHGPGHLRRLYSPRYQTGWRSPSLSIHCRGE